MREFVQLYEVEIIIAILAVAALIGLILLFRELRGAVLNRKKFKTESPPVKSDRDRAATHGQLKLSH
jgi:hypothetical protein